MDYLGLIKKEELIMMTKTLCVYIIAIAVALGLCIFGAVATFNVCPLAALAGYGTFGFVIVTVGKFAIEDEIESIIKKERA